MKPDKLHDALNFINDDLIEEAEMIRQKPIRAHRRISPMLATAAAVVILFSATLVFIRNTLPSIGKDGATNADTSYYPPIAQPSDELAGYDGIGASASDGAKSAGNNDVKLRTGADILYGMLGLNNGYSSLTLKYLSGGVTPPKHYHEAIDSLIKEISASPVVTPSQTELDGKYALAVINIITTDGTEFGIHLYDGAYVLILWDTHDTAWIKLDKSVFNSYLSRLGYTDFDVE